MNRYKAVIIDDEYWARISLKDKLKKFEEIEIVGEAGNIADAKQVIENSKPEILFLDIQLIEGTGFDLLNQIEFPGKVIFVTAYDEFALRAFEINALDYLMKPISDKRLESAIERIHTPNPVNENNFHQKLKTNDRIMATYKDFIHFIRISEIVIIEAAGDYTSVKTMDEKKFLLAKTMNEWESVLPESVFSRVHRSFIINMDHIEKVKKYSPNSISIFINGLNEPVNVSRFYYKKLKERFM